MDNKRWYKKYATCFWFTLAILPFLVALIQYIGFYLVHTDNIQFNDLTTWINQNNFETILENVGSIFQNVTPRILSNSFTDLFKSFDSNIYNFLGIYFGWFAWTFFIHLMVDIIVWLPKIFHSWLDRWC